MGTTFSIKLVSPRVELDMELLNDQVHRLLESANERMSTYAEKSELSLFNASRSTDWFGVSAELCTAIESALSLSRLTNGAFDVTVGPLVNLWGFGPDGSQSEPPAETAITAARDRVGYDKLSTNCQMPALRKNQPDVYVDLSGYAKGYAVDELADLLDDEKLGNYLVEIGGELRMSGHNASGGQWAIAVEKPVDDTRGVQAIVRLTDRAMATSGDYRNFFEYAGQRYSHTIDPGTGRPVAHNAAAVTVISGTAARADGLATALLVLGPVEGFEFAEQENIAAFFLVRDDTRIDEHFTNAFADLIE